MQYCVSDPSSEFQAQSLTSSMGYHICALRGTARMHACTPHCFGVINVFEYTLLSLGSSIKIDMAVSSKLTYLERLISWTSTGFGIPIYLQAFVRI